MSAAAWNVASRIAVRTGASPARRSRGRARRITYLVSNTAGAAASADAWPEPCRRWAITVAAAANEGGVMKWSVAVLMLVLVGCGAREPELAPRSPVAESITITGPDGPIASDLRLRREDYVARNRVSAPSADVVRALPAAFASVGLPVPEIDGRNQMAIVQSHVVSRRLGNARMSSLLDCGRGLAGPH